MAFVWVQQWIALPVIAEELMGDAPAENSLLGFGRTDMNQDESGAAGKPAIGAGNIPTMADLRSPGINAPFHSQYSSIPYPQQRPDQPRLPYQQSQDQGASSFNMGALGGALPDYSSMTSQQHQLQRPLSGASTSALVYQLQQNLQYPTHPAANYSQQPSFNTSLAHQSYSSAYQSGQGVQTGAYGVYPSQHQRSAGPSPQQHSFPTFQQQTPQYLYYTPTYAPQGPPQGHQAQFAQQSGGYGRRSSLPGQNYVTGPESGILGGNPGMAVRMMPGVGGGAEYTAATGYLQGLNRQASDSNLSSVPRGPPRKPKQSGHALWVGNLPPGTTVVDLKDHFSKDATRDIESLFLISKSNCAFVNYRTEASCVAAMHRFHDSRFHGVRLVCRLRRSSTAASGVPTGPSAMSGPRAPSISPQRSPDRQEEEEVTEVAEKPTRQLVDGEATAPPKVAEKFFIVKSLTLQDLELSVRNGIWATQAHNEEVLNKAYETAENVYLIFSANKSGEYFGYARMASPIGKTSPETVPTVSKTEVIEALDGPKSIPTPATEFAPRGRIIDDSARGTIFWEADLSDQEDNAPKAGDNSADAEESVSAQTWGKSFKIEWQSTNRLPFYRTRGLRNPWNANREVKIARDGTELETSVGKRLVQMFHRLGPSSAGPASLPAMPLPPMGGPQMRPF